MRAPLLRSSCLLLLWIASSASAVTIDWSPVGDPGNDCDSQSQGCFGAVDYAYRIGTYDVTNGQYSEFLNARDPLGANLLGLYNSNMGNAAYGGIDFDNLGLPGSRYSAMSDRENRPVNWVSWYDAIRFANWLHNGQGALGDTESGAYTLAGFSATPSNGNSITRNAGATVFLPSEDEWYKAAYYDPGTSSYFVYPTSSNTAPTSSGPTAAPNAANYDFFPDGNLTDVGAYSETTSPWGLFDAAGNVFQWNEALVDGDPPFGPSRTVRGGSFISDASQLEGAYRAPQNPTFESSDRGFRMASIPEPSTGVLTLLGCAIVAWRRRRVSPAPACAR